jgi:hypothetical protein
MKKRILSVLLAMVMALTIIPTASARVAVETAVDMPVAMPISIPAVTLPGVIWDDVEVDWDWDWNWEREIGCDYGWCWNTDWRNPVEEGCSIGEVCLDCGEISWWWSNCRENGTVVWEWEIDEWGYCAGIGECSECGLTDHYGWCWNRGTVEFSMDGCKYSEYCTECDFDYSWFNCWNLDWENPVVDGCSEGYICLDCGEMPWSWNSCRENGTVDWTWSTEWGYCEGQGECYECGAFAWGWCWDRDTYVIEEDGCAYREYCSACDLDYSWTNCWNVDWENPVINDCSESYICLDCGNVGWSWANCRENGTVDWEWNDFWGYCEGQGACVICGEFFWGWCWDKGTLIFEQDGCFNREYCTDCSNDWSWYNCYEFVWGEWSVNEWGYCESIGVCIDCGNEGYGDCFSKGSFDWDTGECDDCGYTWWSRGWAMYDYDSRGWAMNDSGMGYFATESIMMPATSAPQMAGGGRGGDSRDIDEEAEAEEADSGATIISIGEEVIVIDEETTEEDIVAFVTALTADDVGIEIALDVLKFLAGLEVLTEEQIILYDFDGDGSVTINDALEVLKFLAGLPSLIVSL